MRSLVVLLLLAAPLTGCIGSDDPVEEVVTPNIEDEQEPEPVAMRTWTTEQHLGTVTTVRAVDIAANTPASDTVWTLHIDEGVSLMTINVSSSGGELTLLWAPPGCEPNSGCEERQDTITGLLILEVEAPDAGEWMLRFFGAAAGPSTVDYEATIGRMTETTSVNP